jgi:MoaA/NifB/PqqE/SkfB family radical SAM enzyme
MRVHVPRHLSGTDVFLVTNGFRLDSGVCKAIAGAGITRVNISVDTVDAEVYGKLCGCAPGTLAAVLGNIETLLMVRGNKKYPKIFLTSVAMKSTINKMPDVCAWIVKAGLDGHRIQPMIPYDTIGMRDEDITGDARARAIFSECKSILSAGGVYWDIPLSLRDKTISILRGALLVRNKAEYLISSADKLLAKARKPGCGLAGRIVRIDRTGDVKYCDHSAMQPGNLFDGSEIRFDRRVNDTYKRMRKGKMSACSKECPYLIT